MKTAAVLDRVRHKRLILSVTTGRSGTAYLTSVFGYIKGCKAYHEPAPEFSDVLRKVQNDPELARRFLLDRKLPKIALSKTDIYVETSHLACKGFLVPLLEIGVVPDLIIHRRAPRAISLSMYKMGTIPGRTAKGLMFYLSPDDPDVLRLGDWQSLHDYQLCYWYCLEIERQAIKYKQMFGQQGARIAETSLAGLKTFSGLRQMAADLDLSLKCPLWLTRLRFLRNTRVKVNESKETKKDVMLPDNIDDLEEEIVNMVESNELSASFGPGEK